MGNKITQYSRISHHTVSLTGFTGTTLFTVPPSEDFTNGTWDMYDLALSEIGVWEEQERAYIRIGNTIKEFNLIPSGSSGNNIWISGSSGAYSIAANNPTGVDATANYAVAGGINNLANGQGSVTFGRDNATNDDYTSAFGFKVTVSGITSFGAGNTLDVAAANAASFGFGNIVSGDGGFAVGYNNTVRGNYGFAANYNNTSSGIYSFVEGRNSTASGNISHAEGEGTLASGLSSHSEGTATIASGTYSHAEGLENTASGIASHVGGNLSLASGDNSFAHGLSVSATSTGSTAIGYASLASGLRSFAGGSISKTTGFGTIASGETSFAFGSGALAGGENSFAFGIGPSATGQGSVAIGTSSNANGQNSYAFGGSSSGVNSIAFGGSATSTGSTSFGGVANGAYSFAVGGGAITNNIGEYANGYDSRGQYGVIIMTNNILPLTSGTTQLFTNGLSTPFVLQSNTSYMCEVTINIIDNIGQTKEWRGNMLIKNFGGTTTAVGTTALVSTHGDAGLSTITANMLANNTTDSLDVTITLPTATFDELWCVAKIEYTQSRIS